VDSGCLRLFGLAIAALALVASVIILMLLSVVDRFSRGIAPVIYRRLIVRGERSELTHLADKVDEILKSHRIRVQDLSGTRGAPEWRSGLGGVISVVDLANRTPIDLEAVASIAQVSFSPDGRYLYAMNVTQLDDSQSFGVRIWSTDDWRLTRSVQGSRRTMRRVAQLAGAGAGAGYAGISMNGGNIEARDLESDRVLWSVPLVPPALGPAGGGTNLDLVEIAPNGKFVLSYEASTQYDGTGLAKGTLVIRRAADGVVEALYDVVRISHLSIAPDSRSFVYSTASGQTYSALARVPL